MLVRFSVQNLFSFRDEAELSMVASSERIHPSHVIAGPSPSLPRLVRAAVLYGANAAGKSNLVRALQLLKTLVLEGGETSANIKVDRFRLDPACMETPTTFRISFYVKDRLYEYELSVTPKAVVGESLTWVRPTKEELVFRRAGAVDSPEFEFGPSLERGSKEEPEFLSFVARGTRPNQPFLAEAVSRNVKGLVPLVEWFRTSLQVIAPDAPYGPLEVEMDQDRSFRAFFRDVVRSADTGISDVETHEESLDALTDFPEDLRDFAKKHLPDNAFVYAGQEGGKRVAIRRNGDDYVVTRLRTHHPLTCGAEGVASFELDEESDGTRRLFDLVPLLYQSVTRNEPRIFVIDEIGRSLHPHLVAMLFRAHLQAEGSRSQLIATTHESNLLDLELLRRDEIWFVEKDDNASTQLYSLHEFQPRYDKDVRKDYLVGRYGAVPFLGDMTKLIGERDD